MKTKIKQDNNNISDTCETKLQRYFLNISFDGTNYHGWQKQNNAHSVQEELEKKLSIKLKEKIKTIGVGRTDTGVSAFDFTFHFESKEHNLDESFINDLNHFINTDIVIKTIKKVSVNMHARYSAKRRSYKYFIARKKNPFWKYSYFFHKELDFIKLKEAAEIIKTKTNFKSFTKQDEQDVNFISNIYEASWVKSNEFYIFTIKANKFYRGMIRALVGSMIDIGQNKINIKEFEEIFNKQNIIYSSALAPAKGLFFLKAEY